MKMSDAQEGSLGETEIQPLRVPGRKGGDG